VTSAVHMDFGCSDTQSLPTPGQRILNMTLVHPHRLLRRECSFEGAIKSILLHGGDTDTNAGEGCRTHSVRNFCCLQSIFVVSSAACRVHCNETQQLAAIDLLRELCPATAAIVGAMMGALHGAHGIPAAWRTAVLGSASHTGGGGGIRRPQWLAPAQAPGLVEQLMALAQGAPAPPAA
jgi:hypothetical protein